MEILTLGIASIAGLVISFYFFLRQQRNLLDRIQAKSNEEYQYYRSAFKQELKEVKKARENMAKEDDIVTGDTKDETMVTDKFLSGLEEDFAESEIDMDKLKESIRGEK